MIISVRVKGFQSHRKTRLDFHPGVNVIIGSGDQGKTAILRAMRWVCLGSSPGKAAIRHGQKSTSVTTRLAEGVKITRIRSEKGNRVKISATALPAPGRPDAFPGGFKAVAGRLSAFFAHPGTDPVVLAAVGAGQPAEVARIVAMSELNWQAQMDGPFLLSKSGSEAAEVINQACGLALVGQATGAIRLRTTRAARLVEDCKDRIADLSQRHGMFDKVPALRVALESAQAAEWQLEQTRKMANQLEDLLIRLDDQQPAQVELPDLRGLKTQQVVDRAETISSMEGLLSRMENLRQDMEKDDAQIAEIQSTLRKLLKRRCPMCGRKNAQ